LGYKLLESYWQDARSFYKTDFWKELSRKCKERDNYRCKRCSFRAETSEEKRTLHTHHIISRRPVPYPTALDRLDNLQSLCDKCHEIEHGRVFAFRPSSKSAPPKMFRSHSGRRFRRNLNV